MKIEKRFFLSYRYKACVLLLCFVVLLQCSCTKKEPETEEQKQKQATEYDKILEYLPEDERENVRLQTEDERKKFPSLWPSVPIEENAAFYYMRAINFMIDEKAPLGSASNKGKYDEKTLREWVDKNKKALIEVKKALKFATCQFPMLINVERKSRSHETFYLGGLRQLARICSDSGFVAELDGKNDEAAQWYLTCLKMGAHIRRNSTYFENLFSQAISGIGYWRLESLVGNSQISDRILMHIIAECSIAETTIEERVRTIEKEMEKTLWHFSEKSAIKELREKYDEIEEHEDEDDIFAEINNWYSILARMPDQEYKKFLADLPRLSKELQDIACAPLTELVKPDFDLESMLSEKFRSDTFRLFYDSYKLWYYFIAREHFKLRTLQIRAAVALYKNKEGKLPDHMRDLYPRFLPEIPKDPFFDGILKYKRLQNEWIVYSVGLDGEDDDGFEDPDLSFRGPDIVYEGKVKSNIEKRKEWGEIYSSDEEEDDTQPEFEDSLPDFLWESDMPPSDIPSSEGSDE